MRVEQLRDLITVAERGSITAAAQSLFISQSSLSGMIKALEEELDVTIFTRTAKGIRPTGDGELLLEFAREITAQYDELLNRLSASHTTQQNVNLLTYACASNFVSLPLTQQLLKNHPNAMLTIHEVPEAQIIRSILNGVSNIGIGFVSRQNLSSYEKLAENNGLAMETLYEDQVALCVGKNSPFAQRASVHISELSQVPFAASHCCTKNLQSTASSKNISRITVLGNNGLVKQAVAQNEMVALLPHIALYHDPLLASGEIRLIPIEGIPAQKVNCLFYVREKDLTRLELTILDIIREIFRSLPLT